MRYTTGLMAGLGLLLAMMLCSPAPVHAGWGYGPDNIWDAAKNGDLPKVKQYLKADPKLLNALSQYHNNTPLEAAALGGHAEVFTYLLAQGAAVDKKTLMHYASARGNLSIIRAALATGADINAFDKYGETPLMWAVDDAWPLDWKPADVPKLDAIRLLVKSGANVNAKNPLTGETPVMHVLSSDALAVIQYLVENGADVNAKSKHGDSALLGARSLDVLRYLVNKGGDVRAKNDRGDTVFLRIAGGWDTGDNQLSFIIRG